MAKAPVNMSSSYGSHMIEENQFCKLLSDLYKCVATCIYIPYTTHTPHAYTHSHTHTGIRTYAYIHIHTHMHTHAHIPTCIHTHMHIYTHKWRQKNVFQHNSFIWEFHIMYLDHIHFSVLSMSPKLMTSSPKKEESSICVVHIVSWSMAQLPAACPLKKAESFSTCPLARSHQCGKLHFRMLIAVLKGSLWWFSF